MPEKKQKYLVTSALPYANGPIHFGHIAGAYLPADIYVRYLRATGADVVYICGTDEHGVAITIAAEKQGTTPQQIVDRYHKVIKGIFDKFNIRFDNFSRTTIPCHYDISQKFFLELFHQGLIQKQVSRQFYCTHDKMFLPDRYVLGTCPSCAHEKARGDECPACGSWLDSLSLKDPRCSICGNTPEIRETEHWYLQLQDLQPKLEAWLEQQGHWKGNVITFVQAMLKKGLQPRPVTRDLSWGVPVPLDEAKDKVLYVWFDAPIGYISSTMEWAERIGEPDKWKEYWQDKDTRLVHFIGKDNIPFHTIVFPAMLMGQPESWVLPDNVPANEFYNYEGRKFSTSEGWYVDMEDFFSKYNPDAVRFTIIANAPENRDTDFKWKDFQARNNAELADSLGNFINRTLTFAHKYFAGKVPQPGTLSTRDDEVLALCGTTLKNVGELIEGFSFRKAADAFIQLSREGNRYFDEQAPWKTRKHEPERCATTIWVCLQLTLVLGSMARVFMPDSGERIFSMLGLTTENPGWEEAAVRGLEGGAALGAAEVLFRKIEDSEIEEELKTLHEMNEKAQAAQQQAAVEETAPEGKPIIKYDDFAKLDLRIGIVKTAEKKEGSDKLLRMEVDFGSETRTILGGIAKHYQPEQMVGKRVAAVFNLKPRKLMGELSQGMLLAASAGDDLFLLTPDGEAPAGSEIS